VNALIKKWRPEFGNKEDLTILNLLESEDRLSLETVIRLIKNRINK
jgi:hypothetical protein